MTNSYDVAHGLSQVHPGPEEPVEIAQQDDTLARTGNTARDQEMYVAGIRTGEENAKHNAAIRAGMPDGWKLVPNTMTLDMCVAFAETWFSKVRCIDDPEMQDAYAAMLNAAPAAPDAPLASMARAIFGDQIGGQMDAMAAVPSLSSLHGFAPGACDGMNSEDYVNKFRNGGCSFPDCAAPGVSTVEAQPVAWMDPDTQDVISAGRKESWLNEYGAGGAAKAATYTRALGDLRPAPAAGDALELTLAQKYEDACILANANARDAVRWRAYAAQFPEISAAFLAVHGDDSLPTIKGAAITGGYVVVTPAGWDADKAVKLRDAILRLFPVNPAHTPRPSDELASQRKGDA
ncbi:hypothetical protein ACDY99_23840 [Achromobacter dolens]|uniref:hypothetical protein n=1 Tax=Achromobacter dolens TaxID=1287738 RepID=UPI003555D1D8